MDKTDHPTTFGVFKPTGHTLIAFHTPDALQSAAIALKALGFMDSSMVRYTAAEMTALVDAELLVASPLAGFGYELDLIHVYADLAQQGCCFLVVDAPTDELSGQVADLVRSIKPACAQHYGLLMIEDLTQRAPGRMGDEQASV
ncbi:MAG: hypothetical protein RL032_2220 [Pseudomonadota bacterium]|jgi:hypothetical protein